MTSDVAELIDRDATCDALRKNSRRLSALLRRATNPDAPAIGIWTVGDVANHVTWGIENYALWLEDKIAPDLDAIQNMSRWNVETVRQLPAADLPQLAERINVATEEFIGSGVGTSRHYRRVGRGARLHHGRQVHQSAAVLRHPPTAGAQG